MSEQTGSDAGETAERVGVPVADVGATANGSGGEPATPHPGDPVQRELAEVTEAMAQARAGVPTPGGAPTVPDDDEVAGLERAHEALRSTLDRVDRGG